MRPLTATLLVALLAPSLLAQEEPIPDDTPLHQAEPEAPVSEVPS